MKPKSYNGKGEGKKPFPFFDTRELVKADDSCHILIVSTGTLRAIRLLSAFLRWATRWDDSNTEEDVDEFIRRFFMEIIPCDNIISELSQSVSELTIAIQSLKEQGGDMSKKGCGCCCSDDESGVFDPTTYPNVPELPSTISPSSDRDCKFAWYTLDRILGLLDAISTRVGWGTAGITFAAFAALLIGQVEITGALLAVLWSLFTQGMLTASGIARVYAFLNDRREDFVCYVSSNSNNSPASFKQACIQWVNSQGDTNSLELTVLSSLFHLAMFYNNMLSSEWMYAYSDRTCCGGATTEPPVGVYELVPVSSITIGEAIGIDGQPVDYVVSTTESNQLHVHATLEHGKGYFLPLYLLFGASDYVVGIAIKLKELSKTTQADSMVTFVRDIMIEPDNFGQILSGEGISGILETESGEDLDAFKAYLESIGYDVLMELVASDITMINSQDWYNATLYDKESIGGHGGVVDSQWEFFFIRKA